MTLAFTLGTPEILIALVLVLVLFGSKKIPEIARGLGQAQREFREGLSSTTDDEHDSASDRAPR